MFLFTVKGKHTPSLIPRERFSIWVRDGEVLIHQDCIFRASPGMVLPPIAGWFTMENLSQIDDLGGTPILRNLQMYHIV